MKVSQLSERVTFEKSVPAVDENANHFTRWEETYSCRAHAAASSYQQTEKQEAGLTVGEDALVFTVRCCSELKDLDSTHYRVIFRGAPYNITSVDRMDFDRRGLQVSCEKER